MDLFQAFCSFLIQKGLYFQSERPNFIPKGAEQWEILKLVQGFLDVPLDNRISGGEQSRSSILWLRSSSLSSSSSLTPIESGRITSARISASLMSEADVTTSLSNSTNDYADSVSWTAILSNLRKLSSSSYILLNGSSVSVTAFCWFALLILGFLKQL